MSAAPILPYHFAKKYAIVATLKEDKTTIIHVHPIDIPTLLEIKRCISTPLIFEKVSEHDFQKTLATIYQSKHSVTDVAENVEDTMDLSAMAQKLHTEDLLDNQNDAPIIRLLNALFSQAIQKKASDIHIETYEDHVLVRYRMDGVLHQVLEIQRNIAPLIISRVKVMAKLDIAEKRIPQDGRISVRIGGHNIDIRVSTLPSNHGERVVLRILDKEAAQLDLNLLGIDEDTLTRLRRIIAEPHGIILVTGPTGSGKTTSLYAVLTELNEVDRNILTIEDPIEYDLRGIGQTQVNTKINMDFAKGLRAILRQDPDIVMIGEIRDLETAEIAIQASLTGHLVLSTLHTNTALSAVIRMQDMGIEPFLLSSSLIGVIAQRLVRKLCDHCKVPHPITKEERALMKITSKKAYTVFEPKGCPICNDLGYHGRTGIYECISIDDTLRTMIHQRADLQALEIEARRHYPSIRENGFQQVLMGNTSIAEIIRATTESA